MIKDLFETDWEKELQDGDTVTRKEDGDRMEVVLLAGLQRLARLAGIVSQKCVIQTPAPTMVQAIFTTEFAVNKPDERPSRVSFTGTADAIVGGSHANVKGIFAKYPTAIAESRAEARSLRKALGIKMLSSEEVGFREGAGALEASPTGKADTQLIAAIEKLCESRAIQPVAVLEAVLDDDRSSTIFELTELTVDEAQRAMGWLNDQKPKKVTQTAKAKRDARKKELEGKTA